jgi:peptidoglycan/xylan/chitin deacetylase (PgdA/CDA1 family)
MRRYLIIAATVTLVAISWGCRRPGRGHEAPRAAAASEQPQVELDKFWENAREEAYKSVPELLAQHQTELRRGLRYHTLMRGNPAKRQIALTFDDGPHPGYTLKLLDILKRYGAKATFFVVGEKAEQSPDLVKAELAAGHDIGNHTYHHVNLTKIPNDHVATEIKACGKVVQAITGHAPHLFRPPGGDYDRQVAEVAEALGYTMVLWTDDPGDYASPGSKVIESRVVDRIGNGGIILMHDGVQQTLDILPQMLERLTQRGYQFVTIDQMMGRG